MRRSAGASDRGGVTVEFSAVFPVALVIILLSFEALMAATTVERVENAARTGARTASQQQEVSACRSAALDAMPGWLNDKTVTGQASGDDGVSCTVQAKIPLLWPGVPLDFSISRTVTMPLG